MRRSGLLNTFLILLLILAAAVCCFSRAILIPLDNSTAEKVLAAEELLTGKGTLTGLGTMHPAELPVYLLCVRIFGFGTYAAAGAAVCFFMIMFCSGLWILYRRGLLSPLACLIWLGAAGLPDCFLLESILKTPVLTLSLLLFPYFLACFIETRRSGYDIGAGFSLVLLLSSASLPEEELACGVLRSLLKVFRADFSGQPLLQLSTGRYFLNTLILLMLICVLIRFIIGAYRGDLFILTYAAVILLTFFLVILPVRIWSGQRTFLFTWLPFGGAVLMISAYAGSAVKKARFIRNRIPLPAAAYLFFSAAVLLNIGPFVTSRPPGTADKITVFLRERDLLSGYCAPEDYALFSTASKGMLHLTSDPGDPANRFCILSKDAPQICGTGESCEIDSYRITVIP